MGDCHLGRRGTMEGAAEPKQKAPANQEEAEKQIVAKFQEMRDRKQRIAQVIAEQNGEKREYVGVVEALEPLDPSRRAWRKTGGVLVERTCGEVLPAVKEDLSKITDSIEKLTKQYDDLEIEIKDFMKKYNIRPQGQAPPAHSSSKQEENKE